MPTFSVNTADGLITFDAPSSGAIRLAETGTAILNFGNTPAFEASVDVVGQTGITATSRVHAWFQGDTMANNSPDDHVLASASIKLTSGVPVAGVGFTIHADSHFAAWTKSFRVRWTWT